MAVKGIVVGSVEVEVIPSTRDFVRILRRDFAANARSIGERIGSQVGRGIADGIDRTLPNDPLRGLAAGAGRSGGKAGAAYGGAFDTALQGIVRGALRSLPTPTLDVATTAAQQKIRDLYGELATLSDQRIGVDIDAAEATATIERVRSELDALGRDSADVQVRADTAAAVAKLATLEAELARLDGRDVDVDVNVRTNDNDLNTYVGRLQAIALAGAALGPAIVPAATAATAAIGAIGPAAVAAAAGIGVLALGFTGIADAVTATHDAATQAADDAAEAAKAQAAAAQQVVTANDAVATATRNLANVQANADSAAVRSAQAVVTARQGVTRAAQAAADANRSAQRAYAAAERDVATAVRNSTQAQRDLTDARREARQDLEDLASQVANGALDERQAVLDVADAQRALNDARLDPAATVDSVAAAQVAYERAVQNLKDQRRENERLRADKAAADKAGVDGSEKVLDAEQKVKDAATAQAEARRAQADAERNIARVRVEGAQRVEAAEAAVTSALAAQADQARNSAASIEAAAAAIITAQAGVTAAQDKLAEAAGKTSAAQDKANEALAGLSPAGQAFVGFVNGVLRPAFERMRDAAQTGLLPGVQSALEALLPFVGPVSQFIGQLATQLGRMFGAIASGLQNPTWSQFFTDLGQAAPVLLDGVAKVFGNIATGIVALLDAFIPFSVQFTGGLVEMTDAFARWAAGLGDSDGFREFIDYVRRTGPQLLDTLAAIAELIINIGKAAAPLAPVVLAVLRGIANGVNAIPTPILTAVVAAFAALAVGLGVTSAAMGIFNGVTKAFTILAAIARSTTLAWVVQQVALNVAMYANPIGLVILAIVALIAVVVLIVKNFGFFKRIAVDIWEFFRDNWPAILRFITAPIRAAGRFIRDNFNQVRGDATAVYRWIVDTFAKLPAALGRFFDGVAAFAGQTWGKIRDGATAAGRFILDRVDDVVGFIRDLPGRIAEAAGNLFSPILDSFKNVVNSIIGIWNNLSLTIGGGSIAGYTIPSVTLDTPDIPYLAKGGIVTRPTLAVIGEAGPEAVVPLGDSALFAQAVAGGPTDPRTTAQPPSNVSVMQNIYNPLPERASTTGPAALRKAALALGV